MLGLVCALLASSADPRANPASVVTLGNARFTVLTDRLLRLEWSRHAAFEDRETLSFANRNLPTPHFTASQDNATGQLTIESQYVLLNYSSVVQGFTAENLQVKIKETGAVWRPGMTAERNLLGTVESLDGVTGGVDLDCSNVTGCAAHDQACYSQRT